MTRARRWLVLAVSSLTLLGDVAAAQNAPAQDTRILLETGAFDPLRGPQRIPPGLRLASDAATDRWIVQFRAPLTREQRARLSKDFGLKLDRYIPNLAFLERLPGPDLDRLRKDPLVRAAVAYQPAFKISPRIGKVAHRTPERRAMAGLLLFAVLFEDVEPEPVAAALRALPGVSEVVVHDLRKLGAPARLEFRLASTAGLPAVARLEGVRWIEEVAERIEDNGATAGTIQSGTPGTVPVWNKGIHGEGQIVGVIDSGPVDTNHCMFRDPVNNTPGATHRKMLAVAGGAAAAHGTFVAGIVAGDDFNNTGTGANRGNAWAARLVSALNGGALITTLNNNAGLGARIHTNSWHDNTAGAGNPATYNQTAEDADTFMWNNQDHLVLGSMGNNGEEQGPPGTAKNSIGVNASRRDPNEGTVGDGNPGPTADGRRKPDVVTPGCAITSANVGTACGVQPWPGSPNVCATSWATPAASATTALIRQYYTEGWYPSGTARPQNSITPTGALLKATLLNATIDMAGEAGYPSVTEGWGMARLDNTLFFPGSPRRLRAWDVRNADGLATGEFQAFTIEVASSTAPLKVTLAWSDAPGTSGAANPVVNNLDLTVTAPDSTTFRGNVFAGGQSTAGGAPDGLNNVEQVLVNAPAVGMWTIRVGGTAVNVGAPGQGFAVVATARVKAPAIQVPGGVSLAATCLGSATLGDLAVCNTGSDDLLVSGIASSNPQFSVSAPSPGYPVSIAAGTCFPFKVAFNPTAQGPQAATLSVSSNDPETPVVAVSANASGTQKDVRVTGSTAFGVVSAWSPETRTVAVCNVGQCPLTASGATIGCPEFSLVANPLPATLAPGACVDVEVEFTPTVPGPRTCPLQITSDDPDTPVVSRTLSARTPPALSIHAGWVDAHGSFGNTAGTGSSIEIDFVNPVGPNLAWDLRLGRSRFDGTAGQPDTTVWKLGANARYTFNPGDPLRVFVNGGPDVFHFDPGAVEAGLNIGAGLNLRAGKRFSFEATYNYNRALTASPDLAFSQVMAGLLVSF
jgi:hypothetical protein